MSLIGLRVIVLETAGSSGKTLRAGFIRAASDPVYINDDISQIKVCVQFDDRDPCDVQWVNLTDSSVYQSVYINTGLVWARRSLHTSGRNSVVGWPARSFSFFAGEDAYKQMVVVEYFDDKEKVSLPAEHVRKLEVSEAVSFLTQQQTNMSSMLEELRQWEEHHKLMKLLLTEPISLVGCHLMVFRCYSSPWFSAIVTSHDLSSRELMVTDSAVLQEHSIHPAVVQVKLQGNRSVDEVIADLMSSRPRMGRRSSVDNQLLMGTPAPPPPPHMSDYPTALGVWQSPEQHSSFPWMRGNDPHAASGMGTGAGMRVGSSIQNGMHCQDNTVGTTHIQYEGSSVDEGQVKKSTIEYRTNDSTSYVKPKKEPDSDIAEDKVLPVDMCNPSSTLPPVTNSNGSLVDSVTDGSMNPPTMTPTKLQVPFSPTPLPPHLQSHASYGAPQSTALSRAESLPQIPQTFAIPSSMDNYSDLHGNRGDSYLYSFAPPPMPPRPPLRQAVSAIDLTALNPTREMYDGPVLPKRAPTSCFQPPPAKRPNTLHRSISQPNIASNHHHQQMLDDIMSILSEEPELPEPEPGDADMFRPSPNVMSPHGPWGGYPEPGPLSQISAMSMPVLNDPNRYQHYNYLSSPQHMHHSLRISEPYLNQLPLPSGGYVPHVPPIDRPPAHVAKPPEILEAQGQESDQSSECSIFQYENRLNSTGAAEQRHSDGSDTFRGGLDPAYHQLARSLPDISNLGEITAHRVFPRLGNLGAEDPCDNVFNSPLSGHNFNSVFDFTHHGVKNSSSSTQEAKRGRGRPRLSPREKKQREELRIRGIIARNKKRRSKEEMELAKQYKAPGKRGRKAGFKRNSTRESWFANTPNGSVVLQSVFCDRCPGVSHCRDCHQKQGPNEYCRFLDFRRLKVNQEEGTLSTVGFADNSDVTREALIPWIPLKAGYSGMDKEAAMYVLSYVAKNFVTIMLDELRAIECWQDSDTKPIYWKKAVKGVREMCDTCDTTIFNTHWTCEQCGFTVCNTCYFQCLSGSSNQVSSSNCWPPCICSCDQQQESSSQPHSPSSLILVHIIPDIVLWKEVFIQLMELCRRQKVTLPQYDHLLQYASCRINQLQSSVEKSHTLNGNSGTTQHQQGEDSSDTLLFQLLSTSSQEDEVNEVSSWDKMDSTKHCTNSDTCDCYDCHGDHSVSSTNEETIPPRVYGDMGHITMLCDGRMLWIKNPMHDANMASFQEHWRRGEPILVSGIHHQLSPELWSPQSFIRDFGNEVADLVDCYEGLVIRDCSVSHFWEGFENLDVRLKDKTETHYRLLKLKDWPTKDDFCDKLPRRYGDLLSAKPIPDYTRRDGKLNIAASLPHFFVRPDLGPKMYSAYGSASTPDCSTTNLHLDIADAVNVMVYSAIPEGSCDPNYAANEAALIDEVVSRECCSQTTERLRSSNERVGAIWHIYSPSDAPKIRALLAKACEENYHDYHQPPGTDPIHDQCFYLTTELRKRLLEEYGVQGYTIAQCVGDAIFIPAGAPHQVRNLCSCIKVAEDFVSPEHMNKCLQLTEEFRHLSENHTNHEDKLQVKNIIYHTMKDVVGILTTSKLPVAKVTKTAKSSPTKLSTHKSTTASVMATEGKLPNNAVHC